MEYYEDPLCEARKLLEPYGIELTTMPERCNKKCRVYSTCLVKDHILVPL